MTNFEQEITERYFAFLDTFQQVMESRDKIGLKNATSGLLEWRIMGFRKPEKVKLCRKLSAGEKEYLLRLLSSGKEKVWILVDVIGSEH